jgi:dipeptidyl aminopeptidase/acylaminoacyl peptidase
MSVNINLMKHLFILSFLLFTLVTVTAQQAGPDKIRDALATQNCVDVEVKVCKYDYVSDGLSIEAVSFRPEGAGRFPGVLLIPGYQRTALDLIPLGVRLARAGFAGIAVTQPSFGKSQGKADYVGPLTLRVLTEGFRKLQREPYVDKDRMGIYGYSRGGMAASLLAVKMDDVRAAVFGAGIYDFQKVHDEVKIPGIRANMEAETGMTEAAVRERSSIFQMEHLKCPVLILHGEKDENVPVSQAYLLRDRLTALKKDFEIKLYPDRPHSIGAEEVATATIDFFQRKLAAKKH